MAEQNNFESGTDPFDLPISGWIHEESSWCGRWNSWILPGCRKVKYVQHAGNVPDVLRGENCNCCTCQTQLYTKGLTESDRNSNIVGTHEKNCTCGYCFNFGDITFPICNCFPLPYLETKSSDGATIGKTVYICDACCFVPKFDVYDARGNQKYRIRPDTCCVGICVQCRCDAGKKCLRVPFYIRDPKTRDSVRSSKQGVPEEGGRAKIDSLWSGWANECCRKKDAYHILYPANLSAEDKLLLTGSGLLVDLTLFEQKNDDG